MCRVPVLMDIALSDDKRMANKLIEAIDAQVKLHTATHSLVLEPAQFQVLNRAVATITANFLAHSPGSGTAHPQQYRLQHVDAMVGYYLRLSVNFGCTPGWAFAFVRHLFA